MQRITCGDCGYDQQGRAARFCGRCGAKFDAASPTGGRGPRRATAVGLVSVLAIGVAVALVVGRPGRSAPAVDLADESVALPTAVAGDASPLPRATAAGFAPICETNREPRACVVASAVVPAAYVAGPIGDLLVAIEDPVAVSGALTTFTGIDVHTLEPRWAVRRPAGVPVSHGGHLLVVGDRMVSLLDPTDGKDRWNARGRPALSASSPLDEEASTSDVILLVEGDEVVAREVADGDVRWRRPSAPDEIFGGVDVLDGERLLLRGPGGAVVVERATGVDVLELDAAPDQVLGLIGETIIGVDLDVNGDGPVEASRPMGIDLGDGTTRWRLADLAFATVVGNRVVTFDGTTLASLDEWTGQTVWERPSRPPSLLTDRLIASADPDRDVIRYLDPDTGDVLFSRDRPAGEIHQELLGSWLVGWRVDGATFHDPTTGDEIWSLVDAAPAPGGLELRAVSTDPLVVQIGDRLHRIDPPAGADGLPAAQGRPDGDCRVGTRLTRCVTRIRDVDGDGGVAQVAGVVVTSDGAMVRGYDTTDGRRLWETPTDDPYWPAWTAGRFVGMFRMSTIATDPPRTLVVDTTTGFVARGLDGFAEPLGEGLIVVTDEDGEHVHDLGSGSRRLTLVEDDAGSGGFVRRAVIDGVLVSVTGDLVTQLDLATGELQRRTVPDVLDATLVDDVLLAAVGGGTEPAGVRAFVDGGETPTWERLGKVEVVGDTVLRSIEGTTSRLDPATGAAIWEVEANDHDVVTSDTSLLLRWGGHLRIDATTTDPNPDPATSRPAPLLVTYQYGQLEPSVMEVRDLDTGELAWTVDVTDLGAPMGVGDDWLVRATDGQVVVHDRVTGEVLLDHRLPRQDSASIVSTQPLVVQHGQELRFLAVDG